MTPPRQPRREPVTSPKVIAVFRAHGHRTVADLDAAGRVGR